MLHMLMRVPMPRADRLRAAAVLPGVAYIPALPILADVSWAVPLDFLHHLRFERDAQGKKAIEP